MLQILLALLTVYVLGFIVAGFLIAMYFAADADGFGDGLNELLDDWREFVFLALTWPLTVFYALCYGAKRLWQTAPAATTNYGYSMGCEVTPEGARARGAGIRPSYEDLVDVTPKSSVDKS